MILGLGLGLVLQLAAGAAPTSLVIRDTHRSVTVPLVASPAGPMLRADGFGDMLPVKVTHGEGRAYTLEVWGARLELETGVPMVQIGDNARPLVAAPRLQNGRLLIPLQLVSEVFPGIVPNTRWDADKAQLVVFGNSAPPAAATGRAAGQPADVPSPRPADTGAARADDARLPPVPEKHHRRTVVVDAGHGGIDNGMRGPIGSTKLVEKTITLDVALKLGRQLEARGVDVVYTRTRDTLIALDDRGRIANRAAGNLFISIHVNAANPNWKDPRGARGFETYFLSEARTEDARRVEQMENESVRLEGDASHVSTDDPLSFILSAMTQNEHLRESSELAELIQQRLGKMHPGPSRGVKQAGFRVLVTAYMPAVLVEIGFGSNPSEAAYLSNPAKQNEIASAVADATMQYLERYEGRIKSAGEGSSR